LIKKDEELPSKLTEEEQKEIQPVIESVVEKEKFMVSFESMSESEPPMIITQSEFMRRMKEQQAMGGNAMFGAMPEVYNLMVNSNHPLVEAILKEKDEDKKKALAKQSSDLALLAQGMLKGQDLTTFIQRSVEMIK
jgi:molecular chaperone HtpG